jgi:hypothetical protein
MHGATIKDIQLVMSIYKVRTVVTLAMLVQSKKKMRTHSMQLVHKLSWYKTSVSTATACHHQQTGLKHTFGGTSG